MGTLHLQLSPNTRPHARNPRWTVQSSALTRSIDRELRQPRRPTGLMHSAAYIVESLPPSSHRTAPFHTRVERPDRRCVTAHRCHHRGRWSPPWPGESHPRSTTCRCHQSPALSSPPRRATLVPHISNGHPWLRLWRPHLGQCPVNSSAIPCVRDCRSGLSELKCCSTARTWNYTSWQSAESCC